MRPAPKKKRVSYGYFALSILAPSLVYPAIVLPANGKQLESPVTRKGSEIYLEQCAGCHGKSSSTDTQVNTLHRQVRCLDCSRMKLMSDATLFLIIKEGAAAAGFQSGMPAFANELSYDQIIELIGYIRTFCR